MLSEKDGGLSRIREIVGTTCPRDWAPDIQRSIELLNTRVDLMEKHIRSLELERDRLAGDLKQITQLFDTHPNLLERFARRLTRK